MMGLKVVANHQHKGKDHHVGHHQPEKARPAVVAQVVKIQAGYQKAGKYNVNLNYQVIRKTAGKDGIADHDRNANDRYTV